MSENPNAEEARAALDQARTDYRALVLGLSEDELNGDSDNAGWTNRQLCWHMAFGVGAGGQLISRLRRNKGMNPPGPLVGVINFVSLWMVRIRSRGATADSLLAMFDRGHATMLELIDTIGDDEWDNGGIVLGEQTTVAGTFEYTPSHIAEHTAQMRRD